MKTIPPQMIALPVWLMVPHQKEAYLQDVEPSEDKQNDMHSAVTIGDIEDIEGVLEMGIDADNKPHQWAIVYSLMTQLLWNIARLGYEDEKCKAIQVLYELQK